MDDLINSLRMSGTHCPRDAYAKLKENIRMCENALFFGSLPLDETSVTLRNINTEYCNDITLDLNDYARFQIEDYLEYIRFLNFLMYQYWDALRTEPHDTKKQIEISLRFYRELAEGLDYGYKVFCKGGNPYFSYETPLNENMRMCENALRNPALEPEVAAKVLEINSMYEKDLSTTNDPDISNIMGNYWDIVRNGGSLAEQIQLSYRLYKKLQDTIPTASPSTSSSQMTTKG